MYRVLIVDDEPIIVNGMVDFFLQLEHWPLEVYGAYSVEQALHLLENNRLDIVFTDINMPGLDGLQLQKIIVEQWPRCKVIFLTGYSEFEFIQEAMRLQSLDYVLKAEGDDAIIKALGRAVEQLEQEVTMDALIAKANKQAAQAIPYLQKKLLKNLLLDNRLSDHYLQQFQELQIPLSLDNPILLVLARIDSWKHNYSLYDKELLLYALQNLVEEYFGEAVHIVVVEIEYSKQAWFIQPKAGAAADEDKRWEKCATFIQGLLESIQQASMELLVLPLSFVMSRRPTSWQSVSERYEEQNRLLARGLGMGQELLLVYNRSTDMLGQAQADIKLEQVRKKVELLHFHLLNGQQEAFEAVYLEIMNAVPYDGGLGQISQEIYYSLVPLFLPYLNQLEQADIHKLVRMEEHASWEDIIDYFRHFATVIFQQKMQDLKAEEAEVIQKVHAYISDQLGNDLSLVTIAEVIGYNPKYLSRLYKKNTGEEISKYIVRMRISKAKELLRHTNVKISEVSKRVGFLSDPYFYRFFKRETGQTPQEYRDLSKEVDER